MSLWKKVERRFLYSGVDRKGMCVIMYLFNKYTKYNSRGVKVWRSLSATMPINRFMSRSRRGELQPGESIPSMRALAKSIHVSVITVQKAYEDLQRDGFIDTAVGRGSFVAAQNRELYQEEQQRIAEEHLQAAAEIGRTNNIPLERLTKILALFYEDIE